MKQSHDKSMLFASLKEAQQKHGYLSGETITQVAEKVGVDVGDAYGVATFYSFLSTKPQGKNIIRVCQSIPCDLKNYQKVLAMLQEELGVKPGETTKDGRFTLELTNCIGACDNAPAMMINDKVYDSLTPGAIRKILAEY